MRFLGVLKADQDSEAGVPPSPELLERMGKFIEEITRAGVLLGTEALYPSRNASRVRLSGGKAQVTDGPFTETKELIASYALFDVASMTEAKAWTARFLEVLGVGECMIYQIFDTADFEGNPAAP